MSTTTDAIGPSRIRIRPPIHPGEILRDEYLAPLAMNAAGLAAALGLRPAAVEGLVAERTPVTPETALRLGRYFQTTPEFWMNLQIAFDLTRAEDAMRGEIDAIAPRNAA